MLYGGEFVGKRSYSNHPFSGANLLLVSGRVILNNLFLLSQWLFLVPLKGGRDYIIPQKARTISGI